MSHNCYYVKCCTLRLEEEFSLGTASAPPRGHVALPGRSEGTILPPRERDEAFMFSASQFRGACDVDRLGAGRRSDRGG